MDPISIAAAAQAALQLLQLIVNAHAAGSNTVDADDFANATDIERIQLAQLDADIAAKRAVGK